MDIPVGLVAGLPRLGSLKAQGSPSAYPNSPNTAGDESPFETPLKIKEARQQKLDEIHRHGVPETVCKSSEEYEVLRTAAWNDYLNPDCPGDIGPENCSSARLRNTQDVQLWGLVHGGIPRHYRRYIWKQFLQLEEKRAPSEYFKLCTQALMPTSVYVGETAAGTPDSGSPLAHEGSAAASKRRSPLSMGSSGDPEAAADSPGPRCDIPGRDTTDMKRMRSCPSSAESETFRNPSLLKRLHTASTPMELQMSELFPSDNGTPKQGKDSLSPSSPNPSSPMSRQSSWVAIIQRDLERTMPGHPLMQDPANRTALLRILSAYSARNPDVGYCQGMNLLAGVSLVVMGEEEDAFWCLAAMVEDILPGYFSGRYQDSRGDADPVDVDCWILQDLVESHMPALAEHLHNISFSVRALVMPWLMGAFVGSLPLELVLRLWDVMFLEGNTSILFRAALAILDHHAEELMEAEDSGAAYTILVESMPKLHEADPIMIAISSKSFCEISHEHLQNLQKLRIVSPHKEHNCPGASVSASSIRARSSVSEDDLYAPDEEKDAAASRVSWFYLCNSICQ